jgi:hypothetical protein
LHGNRTIHKKLCVGEVFVDVSAELKNITPIASAVALQIAAVDADPKGGI